MRRTVCRIVLLAGLALLTACARTTVGFSGDPPREPLCPGPQEAGRTLVLWWPQWRADQKDVAQREAAAEQGLKDYLAGSRCFPDAMLRRVPAGTPPSASQAAQAALAGDASLGRVVVVAVRELGPVVRLLSSPALVEGGTEVRLDLAHVTRTGSARAHDFSVHWQHGGPGVVRGVGSLPQDLRDALAAAFEPGTPAR